MTLPKIIQSQRSALADLCQRHKVEELYVFGSVLTERFGPDSDLDFLVVFRGVSPEDYADNFFDFRDSLTQLFQRKVDLIEAQTLKNPYFKQIVNRTKKRIYAGGPRAQVAA